MRLDNLSFLLPLGLEQLVSYLFPLDKEWYQNITHKIYAPPSRTLSMIRPLLYILIGIVIVNTDDSSAKKTLYTHLALTYLWTIVFNYFKNITLSLIIIVITVLTLLSYFAYDYGPYSYLLIPALLWHIYLIYLNYNIYQKFI